MLTYQHRQTFAYRLKQSTVITKIMAEKIKGNGKTKIDSKNNYNNYNHNTKQNKKIL